MNLMTLSSKMREDFTQIYAVTDEKFKEEEFNEK